MENPQSSSVSAEVTTTSQQARWARRSDWVVADPAGHNNGNPRTDGADGPNFHRPSQQKAESVTRTYG